MIEKGKVTFDSITEELKPEDKRESYFIYWFDKFISDQQRDFKASTLKH